MKSQMQGPNTTLVVFDGFQPFKLLRFLAFVKEAFYAFGKSEDVAVGALPFSVSDYSRECYMSHVSPGVAQGNSMATTWAHVTHALLQRFHTDDVLQNAYDAVTRERQDTNEG